MNKGIFLRCEATAESGLGHFFRCLDLVRALRSEKKDYRFHFLGDFGTFAEEILKTEKINSTFANWTFHNPPKEYQKGDLFIIDSYVTPLEYYKALEQQGIPYGAFDDFGEYDFHGALFVINFRLKAQELYQYKTPLTGLGPEYFPVRPELKKLRKRKMDQGQSAVEPHVLVFMGGSDLHQKGSLLAKVVGETLPGSQVSYIGWPQDLLEKLPVNVNCLRPQKDLFELLDTVDLMLTGGGRLKYETLYATIPNLVCAQTEGQSADTRILAQEQIVGDLGLASVLYPEKVAQEIETYAEKSWREGVHERCKRVFSSESNELVAQLIDEAFKRS